MALELQLTIVADAADAKRELASVEKGIQKVEDASGKGTSAIGKVTEAFKAQADGSSKLNAAHQKLADTSKALTVSVTDTAKAASLSGQAYVDYQMSLVKTDQKAIEAAATQKVLAESTGKVGSAAGLAAGGISLVTSAYAVAGAAALGYIALIAQSTRYYIENADSAKNLRSEIGSIGEAWNGFQMIVGGAVVGGNTSLAAPVNLLNTALAMTGVMLAQRIQDAKDFAAALFSIVPGGQALMDAFQEGPNRRRGGAAPSGPMPVISPGATAGFGSQFASDQAAQDRALAQLAEQRFQERQRARRQQEAFDAMMAGTGAHTIGLSGLPGFSYGGLGDNVEQWYRSQAIQGSINSVYGRVTTGLDGLRLPGAVNMGGGASQGFFGAAFGGASGFGADAASVIMHALTGGGSMVGGLGSLAGGGIGSQLAKILTSGAGINIGGFAGGAINAIMPGLGALVGPLLQGVVGLFNRDRGRDSVEGFASEHGGFDNLHSELGNLGDEGERLWIRLTQGVGRNNPEQAAAAIDAVTSALERQASKQHDAQIAAVNQSQAQLAGQQAVVDQLTTTLDGLNQQYDALYRTIADEAPEDEIGVLEQRTRDQLAIIDQQRKSVQQQLEEATKSMQEGFDRVTDAINDMTDALGRASDAAGGFSVPGIRPTTQQSDDVIEGFANGTNGYRWFGSGTLAMLHGWEKVVPAGKDRPDGGGRGPTTVVVNLQGREILRYVAQELPSFLEIHGAA